MLVLALLCCLLGLSCYQYSSDQRVDQVNNDYTQEVKSHNNLVVENDYVIVSMSEMGSYEYMKAFMTEISINPDNIFNTGVGTDDFLTGATIIIDTYNSQGLDLDIKFCGYMTQGQVFYTMQSVRRVELYGGMTANPNPSTSLGYPMKYTFKFYPTATFNEWYTVEIRLYQDTNTELITNFVSTTLVSYTNSNNVTSYAITPPMLKYSTRTLNGFLPSSFDSTDVDDKISDAYQRGYQSGYSNGTQIANQEQYNNGYSAGETAGYQSGYSAGYTEGSSLDQTAAVIFAGILDVGLLPVNVFLQIFNFEVFGIHIAGMVSALLTIAVTIIIMRFVMGKKE